MVVPIWCGGWDAARGLLRRRQHMHPCLSSDIQEGASGNPNPLSLAGAPSPGSRLVPGHRAAPGDTPLTAAAVLEEFERARRYVARHGEADMAPEQHELLQVQCGARKCSDEFCTDVPMQMAAAIKLACCYVNVKLTRASYPTISLYWSSAVPGGKTRPPETQGWAEAVVRRRGDDASAVAAAALYVLEVTRANAQWAAWAERDTAFVR